MEIRINKNLLLPIVIIVIALVVGIVLLLSDRTKQKPIASSSKQTDQAAGNTAVAKSQPQISANARTLELVVPGMFCAGCKASVEGYLSSVAGIEFVEARLTPRKSATVIYNPDKISKEEIVKNQVFDTYGPAGIISDEPFNPASTQLNESQKNTVPLAIQQKTNQVSQLLREKQQAGKDISTIQEQLDKVNEFLQKGLNREAENLLDGIIKELENL